MTEIIGGAALTAFLIVSLTWFVIRYVEREE